MIVDNHIRFSDLPISAPLVDALEASGFIHPSPIQAALIPEALKGIDVIGQARTGTGKTAAYMIPILERLDPEVLDPQALILVPTRELALQVVTEGRRMIGDRDLRIAPIYGGHDLQKQIRLLHAGVHVVVGTPGRVIDMIRRGSLKLQTIRTAVLDEADRMLDIGFRKDIETILGKTPVERQTLLLSATMVEEVKKLARNYMREPVILNLSEDEMAVGTISQKYFVVSRERKLLLLLHLLVRDRPRQCLIFCRTKVQVHRLTQKLGQRLRGVVEMSGDLQQNVRNRVMQGFREGKIRIMVATDVVGRGIDVQGISHVINYDIPEDPEQYVHRIGRTGRMGKDGTAYTFVEPDQGRLLTLVEIFVNRQIERDEIDSFKTWDGTHSDDSTMRDRSRRPVNQRRFGGGGRPGGGGGRPGGKGRGGPRVGGRR
jgi:ATP-dependent RNA helicase DeaD